MTLPNVPADQDVLVQVRAWESSFGSSYEEARARGGKFGKSEIFTIRPTAPPFALPATLTGLQSFSLQAGLLRFSVGLIDLVEAREDGAVVWALRGEPGFRYVVERSIWPLDPTWRPFIVLTNSTGTVTFSDVANTNSQAVFYRSRILD